MTATGFIAGPRRTPDGGQRRRRGLALALFLGAAGGCGRKPPATRPPDIVLVTIDTLRADRLGCYGDASARTPVIDRLAAAGARFTSAVAPAPITLPSHASLLTGRYPSAHGVRNNGSFALPSGEATLAESLHAAGYRTGAFIGAYPLARAFGLDQGFLHYDDHLPRSGSGSDRIEASERRAGAVTAAALGWLREQPTEVPILAWVHFFDPHADYAPPPPWDREFADSYRGEIAYTDHELGRLLAGLDQLRPGPRLVIVTSDHGEAFGEHGEQQHGLFVYQATVHIPLVLYWPDRIDPRVIAAPVSLVDVLPTVLALVELPSPVAALDGIDLGPALAGRGSIRERPGVVAETFLPRLEFGWSELRAVRGARFKFIAAPRTELYDLVADPAELTDRSGDLPDQVARSRAFLEETSGATGAGDAGREVPAEVAAHLRTLGYVGGGGAPLAGGGRSDPKDHVADYAALQEANRLARLGHHLDAIQRTRAILDRDRGNPYLWLQLGALHALAGQPTEAEAAYRAVLDLDPSACAAQRGLALAGDLAGADPAELARRYHVALTCNPRQADLTARLAELRFAADRAPEGIDLLVRALVLDPQNQRLRADLAGRYQAAGRHAEVAKLWEDQLQSDPASVTARNGLGVLAMRQGRAEQARRWFEQAIELAPDDPVANGNLGGLLVATGRCTDAVAPLRIAAAASGEPALRTDLALCLLRSGDTLGAIAELTRLEHPDAASASALVALATELAAAGEGDGAALARHLEAVARRPPVAAVEVDTPGIEQ